MPETVLHITLLLSVFVYHRSPGRSPSCYDNEIVMMNHVYKERFPKVSVIQTNIHSTCMHINTLFAHFQTSSWGTPLILTLKASAVFFLWWLVVCDLERILRSCLWPIHAMIPPFLPWVKTYCCVWERESSISLKTCGKSPTAPYGSIVFLQIFTVTAVTKQF